MPSREQNAPLQLRRYGKIAEQHQPDKDVIHRQGLLDQVAGEKLQRLLVGEFTAGIGIQIPPDGAIERQGDSDPHQ